MDVGRVNPIVDACDPWKEVGVFGSLAQWAGAKNKEKPVKLGLEWKGCHSAYDQTCDEERKPKTYGS